MKTNPLPQLISQPKRPKRRAHALTPLFAICGAVALLAGCATEPDSHLVSAPPPPAPNVAVMAAPAAVTTTQTTQTTQTTPTGTVVTTQTVPVNTMIVTQVAPPAMQAEIVLARPSSSHQ